ncbi:MAG: Do family serine endopeptidase [Bacteroidales bacterium]|jgi:Do/DeqQ family serine protease|nr:Do family serine endopeptidase [Bacteroidales bacterium]
MKNLRTISINFILIFICAFIAVWAYNKFFPQSNLVTIKEEHPIKLASYPADAKSTLPDLTFAAENSVHAVVHITTQYMRSESWSSGNSLLDEFLGIRRNQQPQIAQGSGSGVIISDDGFIVTNNHVIERSQKIEIILNDKRKFDARVIGTDSSTDIALLKIEAKDLPFLTFGNSNELKLGEWVLAIGNPFNLTSTVTAGIVSAMTRNLEINNDQLAIESFIQTDAAVNPGNSGGALVNQNGELVGINTAIASRTGSYTGYSFAVPVTIVKKVISDLKEFGEVQRALLGVNISDVNAEIANKLKLKNVEGVYVGDVPENGAAKQAGIKEGDVIISVADTKVKNSSELQEKISQFRPGDDVKIVVLRNGEEKQFTLTLRNKYGDTQVVRDQTEGYLGADFETVNDNEKNRLNIEYGIKIKNLNTGKLKEAGIKESFIITNINKKPIFNVNDLKREIGNAKGGVLVEGMYPNGESAYYIFGIN